MATIKYEAIFNDESYADSEISPSAAWERESTKRMLDGLFTHARRYRDGKSFTHLIKFISRFRFYSPFNAMLVHTQMPGALFVAPPERWVKKYGRAILPNAKPLVILQPRGPVMFVFDISDTEPTEDAEHAEPIPTELLDPFGVRGGHVGKELGRLIENAKRDGVRIQQSQDGSHSAGSVRLTDSRVVATQYCIAGFDKQRNPIYEKVPVHYDLVINGKLTREAQYATLVHELAHLYCGHIGTLNKRWWPDRRGMDKVSQELEAESVSYMVCMRLGIDTPAAEYLSGYMRDGAQIPAISFDCITKVAGMIETMSKERMKMRKE